MVSSRSIIRAGVFFLGIALCLQTLAWAQPGGPWPHPHGDPWPQGRPPAGYHQSSLPEAIAEVVVAGMRLFYDNGVYYRLEGDGYIVVDPPEGAVVRVIPTYYQEIVINGVTYYTYDGVYYVRVRKGYKVVPPPVVTIVQTVPVVTQTASGPAAIPVVTDNQTGSPVPSVKTDTGSLPATVGAPEDEFTVNVPNDKSGYTPVVIKRTKSGFVGPQGEFYPEFPKVAQLKVMYGTQAK